MILAVDPGRFKCGLAVLNESGATAEKKVVGRADLLSQITAFLAKYNFTTVVIGRSAFGKAAEREVAGLPEKLNIVFVSEKDSSRQARQKYWKENPPAGWRRLIPASLLFPPVAVDDFAAEIIGGRYLKS